MSDAIADGSVPDSDPAAIDISPDQSAERVGPRTIYRYSIVRGGVYSEKDVQAAIKGDAVVAAHYVAIEARALHVDRLSADRLVYMSYRIGDEVYWTKHQVRLPRGELILTDGEDQIRARCGNCIALVPKLPTSDNEPAAEEFDTADERSPSLIGSRVPLAGSTLAPHAELPRGIHFPEPTVGGYSPPGAAGGIPFLVSSFETTAANPSDGTSNVFPDTPVAPPALIAPPATPGGPSSASPAPPSGFPNDFGFDHAGGGGGGGANSDTVGDRDDLGDPSVDHPGTDPRDQPLPVPEPGTLLLVGSGVSALIAHRRRTRK